MLTQAVLQGIPSVCYDIRSMAAPACLRPDQMNNLKYVNSFNREQWLHDLAYTQWTSKEIRLGHAWEHYKKNRIPDTMKEVCIVYAGTKFSTDYVVQKRRQLDKHLHKPQDLQCLLTICNNQWIRITCDTRAVLYNEWQLTGRQLWWYKVYMNLISDWMGSVLYLDLDTVIIHDIVHLYKHESDSFMILQDFNPFIQSASH